MQEKVFAIEFDPKAVRVARCLNLIAGDGQTNVLELNTLDWERWKDKTEDPIWQDAYFEGFRKLRKLQADKNSSRNFGFHVLMANPPFAGDLTSRDARIIHKYEIAKNDKGKFKDNISRHILFVDELEFLKPGGRMAVVLPQGVFNNSSDKFIRDFIAKKCRILAVVGLHGNTFKPHTGIKTSVLLCRSGTMTQKRENSAITRKTTIFSLPPNRPKARTTAAIRFSQRTKMEIYYWTRMDTAL